MLSLKQISSRSVMKCRKEVCKTICRTQKTASKKLVLKDHKSYPIAGITKKPPRPPFIKNLFVGNFDPEMMYYPEVAETDRYLALNQILPSAKEFFSHRVDSNQIDRDECVPEDVISGLKDLGLFGNSISSTYGGLDHSCTEYARILEEAAVHPSVFLMLMAHQSFGARAIMKYGSPDQIMRYLSNSASGESIAGICAAEPDAGMDYSGMSSIAELSADETHYVLNGTKIWVVNATQADYFIVAAPTELEPTRRKLNNLLTTFIVEKKTPGIHVTPREEIIGAKGLNICEVKFENVIIPAGSVLGEVGKGFDICSDIFNTDAYLYGSLATGLLKKLFSETIKHVINCTQYQNNVMDMNSVKKTVADITMKIYAVESMTYLTTSILDMYEKPDAELESVATKVFSQHAVQYCVRECLNLVGSKAVLKNFPFERLVRDSQMNPIFNLSVDFSDIYISAVGLNFAGPQFQDLITKMRNPLSYPAAAFRLFMETQRNLKNEPKLTLKLQEYAHPSLKEVCNLLEKAVLRFKFSVLIALTNDGVRVTENHINLRRLSETVMLCYAMTAVIGRASRSYCCGTLNSDHEMMLAECFVRDQYERVDTLVSEICKGPFGTTDLNVEKIADLVFKYKGHAAEHPLNRNII